MLWAEMRKVIILLPDVSLRPSIRTVLSADPSSVVSGASATIVSDALMNPFDGEFPQCNL